MVEPEFIPFCRPTLEAEEIRSVVESLESGWITTGPKVAAFEGQFAESVGAAHAVSVNSATAGLHIALAALDIGEGDEVITSSMTWPSAVNMIELLGAVPVFAEIDAGTLLLDPADTARRVTERTKAIIPVHFAGQPVDMRAFRAIAADSGAVLIEDAAHAVGTAFDGRPIGSGDEIAVFSFHPIKNITTGEGGMVTTQDPDLAERMKVLRFHGVSKDAWARYGKSGSPRYEVIEPAWKYNMLDLQAALGIEQLAKVERFNTRRAALAKRYLDFLADVPEVRAPEIVPWPHEHAWHLFIVRLDLDRLDIDRDGFIAALAEAGVGAGLHFTPVHAHRYYREKYGLAPGALPVTEQVGEEILSLPLYPLLTEEQQDRVMEAVAGIVAAHRRTVD